MDKLKTIQKIKEKVAKKYGFSKMFGSRWKYAMLLTYRKRKQIELYEEVIEEIFKEIKIK